MEGLNTWGKYTVFAGKVTTYEVYIYNGQWNCDVSNTGYCDILTHRSYGRDSRTSGGRHWL